MVFVGFALNNEARIGLIFSKQRDVISYRQIYRYIYIYFISIGFYVHEGTYASRRFRSSTLLEDKYVLPQSISTYSASSRLVSSQDYY